MRLSVNSHLRLAAHRHADDMVTRRYFAHVSSGGRRPADRMRAAGYMGSAHHWLVGENLVWGAGRVLHADRPRARAHAQPAAPQEHAAAQASVRWASG